MNIKFSRIISAETKDGRTIDIRPWAWEEIQWLALEEFGAKVDITHWHPYEGRSSPYSHYRMDISLDRSLVDVFAMRIEPLIDELVERNAKLPALAEG